MNIMYAYIANLTGNLFHSRKDYMKEKIVISPALYWISWCYAFLNFILGIYFLNIKTVLQSRVLVGGFITLDMWGIVFIVVGLNLAYALWNGTWWLLWYAHMSGLAIKLFWAIVLVFVAFHVGFMRILGNMGIWFTLAAIQSVVVIYLFPKEAAITNVGKDIY